MKILFAAKYVPTGPQPIGGVQTWIATIRKQVEAMGHEAVEWQPGMPDPGTGFDLGILANMRRTGDMAARCAKTVCVSHGVISEEKPGAADRLFFVSEGVRRKWSRKGEIIRQPIDLDFWYPTDRERTGVVRFSYRQSSTMCAQAAIEMGMEYQQVSSSTPSQARRILRGAQVVFASGRAALEAMACGAPTVIYDHRSAYQGPLLGTNLDAEMTESYSGRSGQEPELRDLLDAAQSAIAAPVDFWRGWVEERHDAKAIAAELIG